MVGETHNTGIHCRQNSTYFLPHKKPMILWHCFGEVFLHYWGTFFFQRTLFKLTVQTLFFFRKDFRRIRAKRVWINFVGIVSAKGLWTEYTNTVSERFVPRWYRYCSRKAGGQAIVTLFQWMACQCKIFICFQRKSCELTLRNLLQ
jgi:hypothetical protein